MVAGFFRMTHNVSIHVLRILRLYVIILFVLHEYKKAYMKKQDIIESFNKKPLVSGKKKRRGKNQGENSLIKG